MAAALAALVVYALREILAPGFDRLPGTDSGNLYSWELYTRSVLGAGQLPHWNPYQLGGTPHLADTQTTVLYPPALLLRALPPLAFLPWMTALHIWIAASGTLFLARIVGCGWFAAAAAAVAVAFGGSVTPWLHSGYLLLIYAFAWLPWALSLAIASVRRGGWLPHPALVVVLVMQFLAGYLQGTVYVTAAVALYFVFSAFWPERSGPPEGGPHVRHERVRHERRWRPLAQLAIVGALSAGLAAFQLLPTVRLVAEAGRTAGIPFGDAVRGAWSTRDVASFFLADPLAPDRAAYVGWLLAALSPLALFDRHRRRLAVFFVITIACAVALAFGDRLPFYRLHYALFPGFRIPGRALFVASVSLALLGAIGMDRLVAAVTHGRWRPLLASALLAVVAFEMLAFSADAVATIPVTPVDAVRSWLGPRDEGRVLSLCDGSVGPRELLDDRRPTFDGFGGMYLRNYADWAVLSDEGPMRARRDLIDVSNVTSIVSCDPIDMPGVSRLSSVDSVHVYRNDAAWPRAMWTCSGVEVTRRQAIEQLREARYDDEGYLELQQFVNIRWAANVSGEARQALETRYGLADGEQREGRTWRYDLRDGSAANARALIAEPAVEDTHGLDRLTGALVDSSDDEDDGGARRQMLIGAKRCADRGTVDVQAQDRPDGYVAATVSAPVAGVVFFSEPAYSEREAFVDGEPVEAMTANVLFTAVPVPAGEHQVELRYVPRAFYTGTAISLATLGLMIGIAARASTRVRGV